MATGMTELDGNPPFKKRKSIQNADTHATPSPSARTWSQTFNRLTAPFFGVPAFTSPTAPLPKQEDAAPQNTAGYKHVFGEANLKAPDFTFAPPPGKGLFQHTLQAPQLPSRRPATPLKSAPEIAAQTDVGVAGSASAKLRRICAFFSKPAPDPSSAAAIVPTPVPSVQPALPASFNQNAPAQPAPAARPVPAIREGPTRAVMTHSSDGLRQSRNTMTGEVTTVGLGSKTSVFAPTQPAQPVQSAPPAKRHHSKGITRHSSGGLVQFRKVQTGEVTTIDPSGKTDVSTPAHMATVRAAEDPSNMVAQPQLRTGAKRTHAETMTVVPTQRPYPRRASRNIASAVPKLARLSLDDPTFLHAVHVVQGFTDYVFKSHEYIREALYSPRMPISIEQRISLQGNQRLAMLGDSLLKLAILEEWEGRVQSCYETEKEGSLLWCNATLARIGRNNGVDYLLTSLASGHVSGFCTGVVGVATAMEAILGAIWFDCGKDLTVVRKVVRLWFGKALT